MEKYKGRQGRIQAVAYEGWEGEEIRQGLNFHLRV